MSQPAERDVAFFEAETLEDGFDPLVGLGVALDEGDAQAQVDVGGPDVWFDARVEDRNQKTRDEATDEHDVGSRESESADDVGRFGGQPIGEVGVVARDVVSVRFVQDSAP